MVQTLQQHLDNLQSQEYQVLRSLCHLSKNLYNKSLYEIRQHYFEHDEYITYNDNYHNLKENWNYEILPSVPAQQTMRTVHNNFKSFFEKLEKQQSEANIPHYLDKDGFFNLEFTANAFQVKDNHIRIGVPDSYQNEFNCSLTEIKIPFTYDELKEHTIKRLEIIPKADGDYFEYSLTYEGDIEQVDTVEGSWLGIDLGVDNLATCCDWRVRSFIASGRKLKSLNRYYNKEIARLQSIKDKQKITGNTTKIDELYQDRRYVIDNYINETVNLITTYCEVHQIEHVYVGDSRGWKQDINLGDKTNQNFAHIPFDDLKQKLKHKLEARGIVFELVPESHTSKCSFYDEESVEHHEEYVGNRVERGLFEASDGTRYNADVNGAVNMPRKSTGKLNADLFDSAESVERAVSAPWRISHSSSSLTPISIGTSVSAPWRISHSELCSESAETFAKNPQFAVA